MENEYLRIKVTSNVTADTCYDIVCYTYKVEIKSQIIKTEAHTDGFKEFEIEVKEDRIYIIVDKKKYEFNKHLSFCSVENYIYEPDNKLNHNIGYSDYETLFIERKKIKTKKV